MWQSWAHAMAEAERLHLPYGQLVLESLALPWLAMAGDFDAAEAALVRIIALDNRMSLEHSGDATAGALIGLRMWQGRGDEVTPVLTQMEGGPMPVTAIIIVMLLRSGRAEEAAAHYAAHPINVSADDWFSTLNWGMAAEVALVMDDHPLAADVYARLAPYAGHICAAGSSNAAGPVDAFWRWPAAQASRIGSISPCSASIASSNARPAPSARDISSGQSPASSPLWWWCRAVANKSQRAARSRQAFRSSSRGRRRRGGESSQVTPKGVMHHVHHDHVDWSLRGGRLSGQQNLGRPGPGGRGSCHRSRPLTSSVRPASKRWLRCDLDATWGAGDRPATPASR